MADERIHGRSTVQALFDVLDERDRRIRSERRRRRIVCGVIVVAAALFVLAGGDWP